MISFGHGDLADVVQQGAELEVAHLLGTERNLLAQSERQPDHASAVLACVSIVGLDHVAEDERGAAIRVVELEQAGDPIAALACEHGQHAEDRQRPQGGERKLVDVLGDDQRHPREPGVDAVHP